MFSLISGSMQSATLRLCFGLIFAVLTVSSYKAHSEEGSFSPDLDIFTIQPAHSSAVPPAYRINLNLALTRAEDTASFGSGFGNTPRLDHAAEPTPDTIWPTNTRLKNVPDNALYSALNSLSAFLRYESKEDRFVIKPRRNSLFVEWRKSF
jgi:acetylornithine deacetylase/succinyl-diaminopimelate desuccinylase-like protein